MRFELKIGERWHTLNLAHQDSEQVSLSVSGKRLIFKFAQHEGRYLISNGERSWDIALTALSSDKKQAQDSKSTVEIEVGQRQSTSTARASDPSMLKAMLDMKAPMPGRVVAILVKDHEPVKMGQGLLVLEAMKMENEIRAPRDGVVQKILVAVGDNVELAAPLLVLGS